MTQTPRISFDEPHGDALAVPAGAAPTFWQPVPANGHAECILSEKNIRSVHRFSMGTQTLPPGGRVRLHAHDTSEEVFYVLRGQGRAEIGGETHRMAPGATLYMGHNVPHTFINDGDTELQWVWFFMPGGLEDFFAAIGRARQAGEAAPEPFARPSDVLQIEANTVFAPPPHA
ncbi:cupin domain-containing protein [Pseudorhodoferax soli]|uniref:Cupin domain n=1 Tax=Pseudorhodoferax soli TaxID=545864 RepID=A0A368Y8I0_9BURK|nr:cupin domain-containing protein [Pseudorhodoferax soli]RCW76405.1 cupin domain [Pseudorhodoferax soli]